MGRAGSSRGCKFGEAGRRVPSSPGLPPGGGSPIPAPLKLRMRAAGRGVCGGCCAGGVVGASAATCSHRRLPDQVSSVLAGLSEIMLFLSAGWQSYKTS